MAGVIAVVMYEDFFRLRARPFGITPSAELFFHSSAHQQTLARLRGHVLAGEPIVGLTGNIGAGKTTILQVLLRDLPDKFAPAVVVSTQLDEIELTRSMLLAFGAAAAGESREDLRAALRSHLEGLRSRGQRGLIVIDEAQNFSAETMRYLVQLPELGARDGPASLQAIISGQPGLEALLLEAAGESAGQALPLCRLRPLSTMDTGTYVRHRLRVVGTPAGPTFSEDALDLVRVATGGLPRLVNRLCDRVLLSACLDRTKDIDSTRVALAAAELRGELDFSNAQLPLFAQQKPVQDDPPATPPVPPPPEPVDAAVAPDRGAADASHRPQAAPDASDPVLSRQELPPLPESATRHGRLGHRWTAAAVASLLVVFVAWIAYDAPSRNDATQTGASFPPDAAVPAVSVDESRRPPASNTPVAEIPVRTSLRKGPSTVGLSPTGVRTPAPPSGQALAPRAGVGLATAPDSAATPASVGPRVAPSAAPATPSCREMENALHICP